MVTVTQAITCTGTDSEIQQQNIKRTNTKTTYTYLHAHTNTMLSTPRVATLLCTQKRAKNPITLIFYLEIQ